MNHRRLLRDGRRYLRLFRRRFRQRTRGFRRLCRPPESISIQCSGKICRFRITAIRDLSQPFRRTVLVKAAVLEPARGRALAKARDQALALVETATLAATETSPAAEVKEARRQEIIRMAISNEPSVNPKSTCARACSSNRSRNTPRKPDALKSPARLS